MRCLDNFWRGYRTHFCIGFVEQTLHMSISGTRGISPKYDPNEPVTVLPGCCDEVVAGRPNIPSFKTFCTGVGLQQLVVTAVAAPLVRKRSFGEHVIMFGKPVDHFSG